MTSSVVDGEPAPVDAVLHLVFDQDMIDARPLSERGTNVIDLGRPRNQISTELYYEFEVTDIRIVELATGD